MPMVLERALVCEPTTTVAALEAKLIRVPDTVIAGPPDFRVCVSRTYADAEFTVTVIPLIVNVAGGGSLLV